MILCDFVNFASSQDPSTAEKVLALLLNDLQRGAMDSIETRRRRVALGIQPAHEIL
jgi:hypothetical protein